MTDLVNESTDPENFLETLVGDGRKYKTVEELAKAKYHADKFIPLLEDQIETLKEDQKKQMSLLDLYEQKANTAQKATETQDPDQGAVKDTNEVETPSAPPKQSEQQAEPVDSSELLRQLKAELKQEETETTRRNNITRVESVLLDTFGSQDKVDEVVAKAAKDLQVGQEFLMSTAADSPNAFFRLTGLSDSKTNKSGRSNVSSDVNTTGFSSDPSRNRDLSPDTKAYYDELRQADRSKWMSREVQLAMHKAAMADPDRFYGRN